MTDRDLCFGKELKINDNAYEAIEKMMCDPFWTHHKNIRKWAAMRYHRASTIVNLHDTPGFDVVGNLAEMNSDLAGTVRDVSVYNYGVLYD